MSSREAASVTITKTGSDDGKSSSTLIARLFGGSLVKQIMIGTAAGIALARFSKETALAVGLLGSLFVSALKAVAPLLVLVLVIASIANHKQGQKSNIRPIIALYLLSTFSPPWWRWCAVISGRKR